MAERAEIEQVLRELYAARVEARVATLCSLFTEDATFRISGSSDGKPIAICARGTSEIRTWLAMMLKTFRISRHEVLETLIDGKSAAVHWRADINSRITGMLVPTELVDVMEFRDLRICTYSEFFVPC